MTDTTPEFDEPDVEAPDEQGAEPEQATDPLANDDPNDSWGDDDD